jgi:hypothetical protein
VPQPRVIHVYRIDSWSGRDDVILPRSQNQPFFAWVWLVWAVLGVLDLAIRWARHHLCHVSLYTGPSGRKRMAAVSAGRDERGVDPSCGNI